MTSTDAILHMEFIDGTTQSIHLTPTKHSYQIPAEPSSLHIISTYTWLISVSLFTPTQELIEQ